MRELVQVRKKAQVTLPRSIRAKLGVTEGDFIDFQILNGEVVVKAKKLIDADQAWFWTKRWQEGEREANEDIRAGRGRTFDNFEEGIAFLHEQARKHNKEKVTTKRASR